MPRRGPAPLTSTFEATLRLERQPRRHRLDRLVRIGLSYWARGARPRGPALLFGLRAATSHRQMRSAHAVTRHVRPLRGARRGLGALERVLPRCARRRARAAPAGVGLSVRRRAAQSAWTGLSSGPGGAASGRAGQQRPLLPMERADCRRHYPSCALRCPDPRRADRALRRQGLRHQRLFPRPRRLAAGIHFLSSQRRRPHLTIAHDPRYRTTTPWRRRATTGRATAPAWMAPRATRATAKAEGRA